MVSQADRRYDEIGGDEVGGNARRRNTDGRGHHAGAGRHGARWREHDVEAAVLGKLYTLQLGQMGMHEQIENAQPLSTIYGLAEAVNRANQINLRNGLAVHSLLGTSMSNPTKAGQRIINGDANFRPITDEKLASSSSKATEGRGDETCVMRRKDSKGRRNWRNRAYSTDNRGISRCRNGRWS